MATSSLNKTKSQDSTQNYFNRNIYNSVALNSNDVDAVVSYFLKRGFEKIPAINTASILLEQSSIDGISVFQLIDTLKGLTDVQLSDIVAQILNLNRSKCSTIGYRVSAESGLVEQRNIIV